MENLKEILVGSSYSKVEDQEMWTEIVQANMASDGEFTLVWDNFGSCKILKSCI